jgi:hypothetical protein
MDGAGWHSDDIDADFNNVSIIKLSPYSPELNPIEQVWSWLRQRHLANRCFTTTQLLMRCAMLGVVLDCPSPAFGTNQVINPRIIPVG